MKFTLTHLTGSRAGSVQELNGHVLTIGRDPSNALAFDPVVDADVSGFHANFTVQGDQVLLSDLGSSNGTLVNGQRIQGSVPLISGCTVQFGEKGPIVSVQFAAASAGAAATAPGQAGGAVAAGAPGAPGAAPVAPAGQAPGAPVAGAPAAGAPAAAASAAGAQAPAGQAPAGAQAAAGQAPAGGAPAGDDAAPAPPKPPSPLAAKLKGCGLKVVGAVILTIVVGAVCYVFRGQIQRVVPSGAQRYLKKIPGVSLIFSKAKSPTQALPPAARDAKRMLPKGSKKAAPKTDAEPEKTGE